MTDETKPTLNLVVTRGGVPVADQDEGIRQFKAAFRTAAVRGKAISDVIGERARQISGEGWTPEHDDTHVDHELSRAAACYAIGNIAGWPWSLDWWKPTDRRRRLVKAAALLIAEIERIDRAAAKEPTK